MKIPLKIKREIARRNRVFSKATKAQKRVLVAKDVITQLKVGKFEARSGMFVTLPYVTRTKGGDASLQVALLQDKQPCQCCALGSLVLSCTLFANKQTVSDGIAFEALGEMLDGTTGFGVLKNGFEKLFSERQFRLIEYAFENGDGYFGFSSWEDGKLSNGAIARAQDFSARHDDSTELLVAIMKNIIKNKGTFKP